MDINEIAIPFISVLHNEINLFFLTTQPVIVSVVLILKFTLNSIYIRPFRGFPNVSSYFYILID